MSIVRGVLLTAIVVTFIMPLQPRTVLAAVEGSPDIEAMVVGDDEFQLGTSGRLQLMLQNQGTFEGRVAGADDQVLAYGYLMSGMMVAYPCTTAQNLTVTLKSPNPAIAVVGPTVYVGMLSRSCVTPQPLGFDLRIYRYAEVGDYELQLNVSYEYTKDVDWLNPPDSLPLPPDPDAYNPATYQPQFRFAREQVVETIPIRIHVGGSYFSVVKTEVEGLRPGATGSIEIVLANGGETAYDVTAEVLPSGNFVPVDGASYLGTVEQGARVATRFKVAVSHEAMAKTSPLNVRISYTDKRDVAQSTVVTAGIDITPKIQFEIVEAVLDKPMEPGAKREMKVSIKNTSLTSITDAVARINAVDPFSSTDDSAFIGDMAPGEARVATFRIAADDDATVKTYGIDVEVRYRDGNGDVYTSDVMKAYLEVMPRRALPLQTALLIAALITAGGAAGIYAWRAYRAKRARMVSVEGGSDE